MTVPPQPLEWTGDRLRILDQTRLPTEEVILELDGAEATAGAIRRLAVRGAPLIGVAAAYGLALEASRGPEAFARGAELLRHARPTAVNLAWAVDRVRAAGIERAVAEADAIHREDEAACLALSAHGADLLEAALAGRPQPWRIMTHCNAGALAASARGSGLGVVAELGDRRAIEVLACEARPLLQGARLTVWELRRLGLAHALLVDAAAPGLIRTGQVDAVVTGFDRVAANGDVANKVGTYGLALAARAAGIPFLVAGPASSIDLATPTGEAIEIEERDGEEVRTALGRPLTVPGTPVRNPAFDVTPAELVWAVVSERGAARVADGDAVAAIAAPGVPAAEAAGSTAEPTP